MNNPSDVKSKAVWPCSHHRALCEPQGFSRGHLHTITSMQSPTNMASPYFLILGSISNRIVEKNPYKLPASPSFVMPIKKMIADCCVQVLYHIKNLNFHYTFLLYLFFYLFYDILALITLLKRIEAYAAKNINIFFIRKLSYLFRPFWQFYLCLLYIQAASISPILIFGRSVFCFV